MHAVFVDDRLRGLLDFRIGRQTEIILGGEVQPGNSQSAVVAREQTASGARSVAFE